MAFVAPSQRPLKPFPGSGTKGRNGLSTDREVYSIIRDPRMCQRENLRSTNLVRVGHPCAVEINFQFTPTVCVNIL